MTTSTAVLSAEGCVRASVLVGASYRAVSCDQPLPDRQARKRVECGELTVPENRA